MIFIEHHRVRRRRRRKGRGTPAGARVTARSRRGGGRSWHDAFGVSRLVDRHQRNVAPLVQRRVQYFNHEFGSSSTRDGQVKRNAGGLRSARRSATRRLAVGFSRGRREVSRCAGARSGRVDALRAASAGESMVYQSLVKSLRSPSRRTRLVCQRCDYVSRHLDRD